MIELFYRLPMWLTTVLVLGSSLAIGLVASSGFRWMFRLQSTEENAEIAVSLMQVVAAYIGILIAFAGVQVWQDFSDAEQAVHREAASAAELYRDLATFGPETLPARAGLRRYVATVVQDEWPLLAKGGASASTEVALARLFNQVGRIRPRDARDSTIYTQAFLSLNKLVGFRRDRLIHSKSGMPTILWIVGLCGSILIVAYTATFPRTRTNLMMIGGMSVALGLVFLFILIVDRPYMGEFSVSSDELSALPDRFDLLDGINAGEANPAPSQ